MHVWKWEKWCVIRAEHQIQSQRTWVYKRKIENWVFREKTLCMNGSVSFMNQVFAYITYYVNTIKLIDVSLSFNTTQTQNLRCLLWRKVEKIDFLIKKIKINWYLVLPEVIENQKNQTKEINMKIKYKINVN